MPATNRRLPVLSLAAAALALLPALCPRQLPAADATPAAAEAVADHDDLPWQPWSPEAFAEAKREHKLVVLDLEAVWCHWCHVMAATTYRDPAVVALLKGHYVLIRVDQESRPDIANRYEDYGWPATILFDGDGRELAKRRGYIPPAPAAAMFQAFVDDPTPGPSVTEGGGPAPLPATSTLAPADHARLDAVFRARYDHAQSAWGGPQKFIDHDSMEYALHLAQGGDAEAATMARDTLDHARALIDPVWGGIYQYSTDGDWAHPHFERIMTAQADNCRLYALGYTLWHRGADLQSAQKIADFLVNFLATPDGAFRTSMDADRVQGEHGAEYFAQDDAGRRKLGLPRIDPHCYARENGLAITALVALHDADGDPAPLAAALRAANWVIANRTGDHGLFRHDDHDAAGPYLGDTLAMGQAFLALDAATGDGQWLDRAQAAADALAVFAADDGYRTALTASGTPATEPERDENLALARFANLVDQHRHDPALRAMAEKAYRCAAAPALAGEGGAAGVLLAADELAHEPLHIAVVGAKTDATAMALHALALTAPVAYRRVDWIDPADHAGLGFLPTTPAPAAYLCTNGACSRPSMTTDQLNARMAKAGIIPAPERK